MDKNVERFSCWLFSETEEGKLERQAQFVREWEHGEKRGRHHNGSSHIVTFSSCCILLWLICLFVGAVSTESLEVCVGVAGPCRHHGCLKCQWIEEPFRCDCKCHLHLKKRHLWSRFDGDWDGAKKMGHWKRQGWGQRVLATRLLVCQWSSIWSVWSWLLAWREIAWMPSKLACCGLHRCLPAKTLRNQFLLHWADLPRRPAKLSLKWCLFAMDRVQAPTSNSALTLHQNSLCQNDTRLFAQMIASAVQFCHIKTVC